MGGAHAIDDVLLAQIEDLIRLELKIGRRSTESIETAPGVRVGGFKPTAVILDATLAAADFLAVPGGSVDPAEPNATVCLWSAADGKYTQTERRLAVSNHSSSAHAIDTAGAALWIDGHYWFFGDCDPLSSRPTPPWETGA